jgi:hypothetical protein
VAKATAIGVDAPALSAVGEAAVGEAAVGEAAVHPDDDVVPAVEVVPAEHASHPVDAAAAVAIPSYGLP